MSKDVKRMYLEEAESFTRAIKSCRNSRAYSSDSLSIFHLKNLGPIATENRTALYNDSLKSPSSVHLEDLISHPDSQARQRLITRHLLVVVVVVCPLQPSSSVNSGCPGPESSILVSSRWACPISSQVTDH